MQTYNMAGRKKVAVIGAGPSGLVSLKTLLADGHQVTCYDMSTTIGGLWNYEVFKTEKGYQTVDNYDQPIQGIYKSLLLNTSKEVSAFSDFPDTEAKNNKFLSHWEYRDYLSRYAKNFNLESNIQLETKIDQLVKRKDGWTVHGQSKAKVVFQENFDFVFIATGCFKFPYVPEFTGLKENYKGVVLHTTQVRDEAIFKDKRVLVIGGGYSGCEVAVGAMGTQVAKIYFCFTNEPDKRNHWAMSRFVQGLQDPDGPQAPWDHCVTRYEYFENSDQFGERLQTWLHLMHSKDGKKELRFPGDRLALTNVDVLVGGMKSKQIEKVGPIDHFETQDVILKDGTRLKDIDFVVMATGFRQRYPIVDNIWRPDEQVKCELYRYMLLPEVQMDGLAFVLSCPSALALFPIMEMQARWITNKLVPKNYDNNGSLFTESEREAMRQEVKDTRQAQPDDLPYNYLVDNPGYMENLANDIGCTPPSYEDLQASGDEGKLLAAAIRYGPILGSHYRIQGPGKWDGAKDVIIDVGKRVLGPDKIKEYLN